MMGEDRVMITRVQLIDVTSPAQPPLPFPPFADLATASESSEAGGCGYRLRLPIKATRC